MLLAFLAGCAGSPDPKPQPPAASPAVRGADSGVELRWWVVPDDGDVVARALAAYETAATPIDGPGRDAWRANGLRLVSVPVAELAPLQAHFQQLRSQVVVNDLRAAGVGDADLSRVAATLPPAASTSQEQWLGEVPRWTDAVRGPQMGPGTGRGTVIKMDTGPLALGPGRLRLLLRAWSVPTLLAPDHASAGLHVELAPQFEPAVNDAEEHDLGLLPPLQLEERGLVLSRLVLSMTLDGSEAILIVAARPNEDWAAVASGKPAPPRPPTSVFGPPDPEGVTLGEAMLTSEAPLGPAPGAPSVARGPAKAVIVLVPHVRDRFELAKP
jgi:hypothetical protein